MPVELWTSIDPPGDLESPAAMLLGPYVPGDDVAALGHALGGSPGRVPAWRRFARTSDWACGLDTDSGGRR